MFWIRLLLQRSQRTPARKRLESKGEITMLPQTLELRHGARARLRWRQAFFQRCEAASLNAPRQWDDSLTLHFLESRPSRAGSSPGLKPARMLTGMSWRVTSLRNGQDNLESKSGRWERRGSQKVRLRNDCRRAPRSRSASSEKWCRMRLPMQASASIFGRV